VKRELEAHAGDSLEPTRPVTARDVIAFVVDNCRTQGLVVPPSWKEILGQHARSLLKAGVDQSVVMGACYMAVMRGRPEIAQHIAGDLQLAQTGMRMSRDEYEQKLSLHAAEKKGDPLADARERRSR
jgi:hypothetical protein